MFAHHGRAVTRQGMRLIATGIAMPYRRYAVIAIIAIAAMGCVVGEAAEPGDPDANAVDAKMLARIPAYKTDANVALPFPSQLGSFLVSLYVSAGQDEYNKIHPSAVGSHAQLPVGAVIVREVFGSDGKVAKLTVMGKGPAGYDPRLGDWWFAVTDPNGRPLVENGHTQEGQLTACHSCHNARAQDDFLFGAP